MIPDFTYNYDGYPGFQRVQLPAQEGNVCFHVVVPGIGIIAPDLIDQGFLGKDVLPLIIR